MPIFAKAPESSYTPAPEGLYQGVCCDVWDPWVQENKFTGLQQDKTRLVWQLDKINEETGKPFEVSQTYTLSLHEKASLCKMLETWRGKPFTAEEKMGFDLEKLIGANGQVNVVHNITDQGKRYANVSAVVPLGRGMTPMLISNDFIRNKFKATPQQEDEETPF